MRNFEWCVYTYKHRRAFEYVAKRHIKDEKLLGQILERARYHDLDKLLLYLFMPWEKVIEYHMTHKNHHPECTNEKSYVDLVEMIVDYECAPYTKPDKTLNCYDFVNKLIRENRMEESMAEQLFAIMKLLGIDSSYDVTKDEECIEFLSSLPEVTEEMILLDVMEYVRTDPKEELEYIGTISDAADYIMRGAICRVE